MTDRSILPSENNTESLATTCGALLNAGAFAAVSSATHSVPMWRTTFVPDGGNLSGKRLRDFTLRPSVIQNNTFNPITIQLVSRIGLAWAFRGPWPAKRFR